MNDQITQHLQIDDHFVQVDKMVWNNTDFNPFEFKGIKIQAGPNSFSVAIKKTCENSEQLACNHFVEMHEMVDIYSAPLTSFRQSGQPTDDHFHQVVKMVRIRSRIQNHRMDTFSMSVLRQLVFAHSFGLTSGKRN